MPERGGGKANGEFQHRGLSFVRIRVRSRLLCRRSKSFQGSKNLVLLFRRAPERIEFIGFSGAEIPGGQQGEESPVFQGLPPYLKIAVDAEAAVRLRG